MSKSYYECHITFEGHAPTGQAILRGSSWTFSKIDGDPVMGAGVRMYATKHFNSRVSEDTIWEEMQHLRAVLDRNLGLNVTRCKIEKVLRDERYDS